MGRSKCGAKPHVGVTIFLLEWSLSSYCQDPCKEGCLSTTWLGLSSSFFASSFLCCRASLSVDGLDQHPLTRLPAWTGSSLASLSPTLTRSCLIPCYLFAVRVCPAFAKQAPACSHRLFFFFNLPPSSPILSPTPSFVSPIHPQFA